MNKEDLSAAIKEVKGIADEGEKATKGVNMREIKQKIKELWALKVRPTKLENPARKSTCYAAA